MKVYRSIAEASGGALRGGAIAVGNFDGVHHGHQALLRAARALAGRQGGPAAALTFDPHPVRVLRPGLAPPVLTPLPRKLEILEALGLDAVVVQPFSLEWAATSAAEFVERELARGMGVSDVVVGWDFTAGHERARVDALRPLLAAAGVALHVIDPISSDGLIVSSTKIREFLLEGKVEAAALLLSRPHDVDGVVARGAGRGRGFGFATANVATGGLLPAHGVYVIRAFVGGGAGFEGASIHGGVCNIGVKPTVEAGAREAAEAHLFDFDGRDLYGEPIRVAFLSRLRDERRFDSIEALKAQIAADAERARQYLAAVEPPADEG
ncbi:MAG TPA: riboflavin biosynthesis protein RibF [Anaeromyxobacteraceae bacterium]|nr:riboflavin biosynthesis protein RibF [Anaeromyxobacteraceae bacterium]